MQSSCDEMGMKYVYLRHAEDAVDCTDTSYDVIFRTSITSQERTALFQHATALLYTPDREHFGIVPLEVCGFFSSRRLFSRIIHCCNYFNRLCKQDYQSLR